MLNVIQEAKLTRRSSLSGLLEGKGNRLIINEDTDKDLVTKALFEGYHLTSEILQEIEFIDKVNYTFTYTDSKGRFHRAGDMALDVSFVKLEAASKGRGWSLRMNSSIVKAKIAAQSAGKEIDAMINLHFQKFAEPYFEYERNNNTGQKINNGILAEAFERHWENMQHSLQGDPSQFNKNSIGNDLESEGSRWQLQRQSSGNAPYYTGPDTLYAQVKNANASLIDNVNTVLNTMDALIKLFDNTLSEQNLAENLQKAFQASPEASNITAKIQDGIQEQERQDILEEVAYELGTTSNNVSVTKKGNKIIFNIINTIKT